MLLGMSPKKHKKHHKHRHKRRKESDSLGDGGDLGGVDDTNQPPTIKLKLKIGTETMGTKRCEKMVYMSFLYCYIAV